MKALVLFSGGLDSTVCLAKAVEKYGKEEVMALSVYYGQKHSKEIEASNKIADYYGISHRTLDLNAIFEDSNCSLLTSSSEAVPTGDYSEQLSTNPGSPVSTYVPFRNGLFLSAAAAVAIANGCEMLYYGIHSDDAAGNAYPDTSEAFNKSMSDAIYIGSGDAIMVEAPFVSLNKAEVVKEGLRLKVPFELTWSCYEGNDKPCGKCGTCIDRIKAFKSNGVEDPLEYMD